jgi:hypothetical protein
MSERVGRGVATYISQRPIPSSETIAYETYMGGRGKNIHLVDLPLLLLELRG